MRKQGLLLGNGLLRDNPRAKSWSELIGDLAFDLGEPPSGPIPLDLYFDLMLNKAQTQSNDLSKKARLDSKDQLASALKERDVESGLKRYIASFFNEQSAIPPRNRDAWNLLMSKKPQVLLTTNYDTRIEVALSIDDKRITFDSKLLETASYTGTVGKASENQWLCSIYHCHGSIDAPASICIGRKDYVRLLTQIERWNDDHMFKSPNTLDTWYERFLDTDISIIGLGLGFEELDLWDLIKIRHNHLLTSSNNEHNRITYFSPRLYGSSLSPVEQARNQALTALNVAVVEIGGRDYPECYERICGTAADMMIESSPAWRY